MENIKIIEVTQIDGSIVEMVEIEVAAGQFVSMTKEAYDKQQAEQSTPNLTNEPAAKS
jgi:hypothetical protein